MAGGQVSLVKYFNFKAGLFDFCFGASPAKDHLVVTGCNFGFLRIGRKGYPELLLLNRNPLALFYCKPDGFFQCNSIGVRNPDPGAGRDSQSYSS